MSDRIEELAGELADLSQEGRWSKTRTNQIASIAAVLCKCVPDIPRVLEWFRDPNRKPAHLAFTAGPDRELADELEMIASAKKVGFNPSESRRMQGCCIDCGRKYGDEHGFPDLVIPNESWSKISPTGDDGGLLCPSCICRRLHDAGIETTGVFRSGPLCAKESVSANLPETPDSSPPDIHRNNDSAAWRMDDANRQLSGSPAVLDLPDGTGVWIRKRDTIAAQYVAVERMHDYSHVVIAMRLSGFWELVSNKVDSLPRGGWSRAVPESEVVELREEVERLREVWLPCDQTIQCAFCGWIDLENDKGIREPHSDNCPIGYMTNSLEREANKLSQEVERLIKQRDDAIESWQDERRLLSQERDRIAELESSRYPRLIESGPLPDDHMIFSKNVRTKEVTARWTGMLEEHASISRQAGWTFWDYGPLAYESPAKCVPTAKNQRVTMST